MFQSIKLQNFLSFGPDAPEIGLRPLNVLIGRNGSGKSNFIEAIDLFILAPNKNPATERSFCAVAASPSSQRSCRLRLLPAPCHDTKILAHLLGFLSGASIRSAPHDMAKVISDGGGVTDWLHKANRGKTVPATIEFIVKNDAAISRRTFPFLRYSLSDGDAIRRGRRRAKPFKTLPPTRGKDFRLSSKKRAFKGGCQGICLRQA